MIEETEDLKWEAIKFIAVHGISRFIEEGIKRKVFSDKASGLNRIQSLIDYLSENDEFEWCQTMNEAKKTFENNTK